MQFLSLPEHGDVQINLERWCLDGMKCSYPIRAAFLMGRDGRSSSLRRLVLVTERRLWMVIVMLC